MTYNIEKEIKELAALTGRDLKEVMKEYEAKEQGGVIVVWGRNDENRLKFNLRAIKEEQRKAEIRRERLSGFHWTKIDGEWMVAGDFNKVAEGSIITIVKASGEKQERIVVEVSGDKQSAKVK